MDPISVPSKIDVVSSTKNRAEFVIEPCYPGYGPTLGNALRRVLLSSLPGAAITAVKIEGVDHEFSTIPSVKEDVVSIILNLKLLRFKVHADGPVTLKLNAHGEKVATSSDFEPSSEVEVVNLKQPIATLTDKASKLSLEVSISNGRGYVPVENREKEKLEIGWIAIDAIYTPMKTVNFTIENVRVGQITNYDKLILDVETDGTIRPEEAVTQAAKILVDHFNEFLKIAPRGDAELKKKRSRAKKEVAEPVMEQEPTTPPETNEEPHATP